MALFVQERRVSESSRGLRGVTFYSNVITATDYAHGGGAFVEGGVLHVEATTFRGNSAWATRSCFGGGVAIPAFRQSEPQSWLEVRK